MGILVGWPAALALVEWVRGHAPFGGLPLGGIPLGQVAGPLAAVSRLGGPALLTGVTAAAGAGLAILGGSVVGSDGAERRRSALSGVVTLAVVVAVVAAGRLSPDGSGPAPRPIRVAAIQGGGPRGLHAIATDAADVFDRQIAASAALHPPLDLVVWPEDVVSVDQPVDTSPEGATMAQLAKRLAATVVAGVVEDVGAARFRNAAVAWSPAGVIVARYDKVHRVPFGEYVPGRTFFEHLANLDLVPRDAIAGRGPGLLDTPAGRLGAVISFEVFFEDRARAAIHAGGELLLVPTNASSYRTTQVPAQEVAAAQLRAWETGRDVVQAAPTGFSAFIDHDGHVLARSVLGRPEALTGTLTLRRGQTWFVCWGSLPILVLAAIGLVASYRRNHHPG
jgi:apolipoprotein N-acyltransferase